MANFILQFAVKKLSKLDQKYSEELKDAKQKNFVTQHAAFRYLALDYGLNQVSIAGLNPDKEPSAKRLGELKNMLKLIVFSIFILKKMLMINLPKHSPKKQK